MIGLNKIEINQATMIEAIQEYMDKRYTPKIKVTKVVGAVINNYTATFEVSLEGEIKPT